MTVIEAPTPQAAGDPVAAPGLPLILNDCYFEINGVNLRCFVKHLEATAVDVQKVTVTTFCSRTDYPGTVKYTLKVTFYQSFATGSVYDTLAAALAAYKSANTPCNFKARPYAGRVAAADNPVVSGMVVPTDFVILSGDAGEASEVDIEWDLIGAPSVDRGSVAATGAVAGAPGYFTPSGATTPANMAALSGVTASPNTAWTTGQFVRTLDQLGSHWSGSAWVAGVA